MLLLLICLLGCSIAKPLNVRSTGDAYDSPGTWDTANVSTISTAATTPTSMHFMKQNLSRNTGPADPYWQEDQGWHICIQGYDETSAISVPNALDFINWLHIYLIADMNLGRADLDSNYDSDMFFYRAGREDPVVPGGDDWIVFQLNINQTISYGRLLSILLRLRDWAHLWEEAELPMPMARTILLATYDDDGLAQIIVSGDIRLANDATNEPVLRRRVSISGSNTTIVEI